MEILVKRHYDLVHSYIPIDKIAKIFKEINIAEAIKVEGMFTNPNTYNILGSPVLYSTVLVGLVILLIPVIVCLIRYFGKRQVV